MTVITRFAPSPTGVLHVGSARTALFNYLFAKHHGGKCLLRIEDTDAARSTEANTEALLKGLSWLGLDFDDETVYQSKNIQRHQEVAEKLLAEGKAYKCFCTAEELEAMRLQTGGYNREWRERDDHDDKPYTIRIKMPLHGETTVQDKVQGSVTVDNKELDDFVLLRADGTPTYMLSVVVDDHDMNISHVIRGDDHLNNTFRQYHVYKACGWDIPEFAHIPLIHGSDGGKLSKRHGAVGVEQWRKDGFLSEALVNYLLLLGWHPEDDEQEILNLEEAVKQFKLEDISKGAAQFDVDKLTFINGHYIRHKPVEDLLPLVDISQYNASEQQIKWYKQGFAALQERAKTTMHLADMAAIYLGNPQPSAEVLEEITDETKGWLKQVISILSSAEDWDHENLFNLCKDLSKDLGIKIAKLAVPMRIALTGSNAAPSNFEIMEILGKEESLKRLKLFA